MSNKLKVAIACPGVGLVQRGFERLFSDLFGVIEASVDITLFKGGGAIREREKIPFFLPRNGKFLKTVPLHWLIGRTRMHVECLTFGLALIQHIKAEEYNVVHTIDAPLTKLLFHFRNKFNLNFRLLHTEGTAVTPQDYSPSDFIHHLSLETLNKAEAFGYAQERMCLIPGGVHPHSFVTQFSRSELRKKYNISEDTFVILSVAALNRYHKRIDYVLDEFAQLDGDVLLMLDGSLDHGDPDLIPIAQQRFGDRCRISRVNSDDVGELYALADVKVLASLYEAFALVVPEALIAGAAVLTHHSEHFRWLIGHEQNLVDMSKPGELSQRLNAIRANPDTIDALRHADEMRNKLAWERIYYDYIDMYHQVANLSTLKSRSELMNPTCAAVR